VLKGVGVGASFLCLVKETWKMFRYWSVLSGTKLHTKKRITRMCKYCGAKDGTDCDDYCCTKWKERVTLEDVKIAQDRLWQINNGEIPIDEDDVEWED